MAPWRESTRFTAFYRAWHASLHRKAHQTVVPSPRLLLPAERVDPVHGADRRLELPRLSPPPLKTACHQFHRRQLVSSAGSVAASTLRRHNPAISSLLFRYVSRLGCRSRRRGRRGRRRGNRDGGRGCCAFAGLRRRDVLHYALLRGSAPRMRSPQIGQAQAGQEKHRRQDRGRAKENWPTTRPRTGFPRIRSRTRRPCRPLCHVATG